MEFVTPEEYMQRQNLNRPTISNDVLSLLSAANSFITDWLNFSSDSEYIEIYKNRQKYFLSPGVASIDAIESLEGLKVNSGFNYLGDGILYFSTIPLPGMYKISLTMGTLENGKVPESIKQAVVMLVEHWEKKNYLESRTFGGETIQSTSKTTGIPTHIRSILELYRNY